MMLFKLLMMDVECQLELMQKQEFQQLKQFLRYYMPVENLAVEDTKYLVVCMELELQL